MRLFLWRGEIHSGRCRVVASAIVKNTVILSAAEGPLHGFVHHNRAKEFSHCGDIRRSRNVFGLVHQIHERGGLSTRACALAQDDNLTILQEHIQERSCSTGPSVLSLPLHPFCQQSLGFFQFSPAFRASASSGAVESRSACAWPSLGLWARPALRPGSRSPAETQSSRGFVLTRI